MTTPVDLDELEWWLKAEDRAGYGPRDQATMKGFLRRMADIIRELREARAERLKTADAVPYHMIHGDELGWLLFGATATPPETEDYARLGWDASEIADRLEATARKLRALKP